MAASAHALAQGSTMPALAPGVLRLYSMRFCPFAQRTRLVLHHKNIPHETVNVDLKHKPDWFLRLNPRGLVPILQQDDMVVYESSICGEYLEEAYPSPPLLPRDPRARAHARLVMDKFNEVTSAFNAMKSRKVEKKIKGLQTAQEAFAKFEGFLKDKFFGGDSPGLVDYHLWPWFERLPATRRLSGGLDLLPEEEFPRLASWTAAMRETPAVRATAFSTDLHVRFFASFGEGYPAYDAGLPAARL